MIDAVVTGADGFIGRALVERLTHDGQNIFAAGRSARRMEDPLFWEELPAARTLYHLAGKTYVPDSWRDPGGFVTANVVGTQNALTWCKRHEARLVLASAYIYGLPERLPIHEEDPVKPNNPYAMSKHLAEQLCAFASEYEKIDVAVLRLFNVYGPGQRGDFLIPTLLSQIVSGGEVKVMDLTPRRDFVFIDDVIEAFVRAANAPQGFHRFNIGSGQSHSVGEIIGMMQSVCGTALPVTSACLTRRNEITDVQADIGRAAEILDWRPQVDFPAGIRIMLKEQSRDGSQRPDQQG